jgi:hypothetical protein
MYCVQGGQSMVNLPVKEKTLKTRLSLLKRKIL